MSLEDATPQKLLLMGMNPFPVLPVSQPTAKKLGEPDHENCLGGCTWFGCTSLQPRESLQLFARENEFISFILLAQRDWFYPVHISVSLSSFLQCLISHVKRVYSLNLSTISEIA